MKRRTYSYDANVVMMCTDENCTMWFKLTFLFQFAEQFSSSMSSELMSVGFLVLLMYPNTGPINHTSFSAFELFNGIFFLKIPTEAKIECCVKNKI